MIERRSRLVSHSRACSRLTCPRSRRSKIEPPSRYSITMSSRPRCSPTSKTVTTLRRPEARSRQRLALEPGPGLGPARSGPRQLHATVRSRTGRSRYTSPIPRARRASARSISSESTLVARSHSNTRTRRVSTRPERVTAQQEAEAAVDAGSSGSSQRERDVLARPESTALDVCHDGGNAGDLVVTHDPGAELGANDAAVDELVSARQTPRAIEQREARRGAATAR